MLEKQDVRKNRNGSHKTDSNGLIREGGRENARRAQRG